MTQDQTIDRGRRAREILEDPLVVEAFATFRANVIERWKATAIRDTDAREALWHMLKACDGFEADFRQLVEDGKMAEHRAGEPPAA